MIFNLFGNMYTLIISLELQPYSNLVRTEIAESFGVSQSPIREAIHRLEQEGLLRIRMLNRAATRQKHFPSFDSTQGGSPRNDSAPLTRG